jgi:hypothetical protein
MRNGELISPITPSAESYSSQKEVIVMAGLAAFAKASAAE